MKSVVYVHYQKCERDGSFVHTRMFAREFGQLCEQQDIKFTVIQPPVVDSDGVPEASCWQKIKTYLSRYYISDIKALLVQCRNMQRERRQLKACNADMVLTRYNWNTLSIIWAARSLKIPVLLEINSPDEEDRGMHFYRLPGMAYFFSTPRALRLANGGFAVSEALAQQFRPRLPANKPVVSIPNGVDIAQFDPTLDGVSLRASLGIANTDVVIGFVGSFAPWHGLEMLFDTFVELRAQGLPVHLLLVGQPRVDAGDWLHVAQSDKYQPHVTFAGHVAQARINEYLAAMDIAVLSNSAWYCSPLKVFEYMAMAKAIVAVATAPVREMLADEHEGLLFEQGNRAALCEQLQRLVNDAELRARLGAAARHKVATEYTWADNARRVMALMERAERE